MSRYECLINEYFFLDIREDNDMPKNLSGLYYDYCIQINKRLSLYSKTGVLAEELGHYETTYGDIIDLKDVRKKKLEVVARRWGYEKILSLDKLIECFEEGHRTIGDVCLYLEVTDTYLKNALDSYAERFGNKKVYKNYEISFDPFNIYKL